MEKLISPQKLLEDWRTDDFINKQFLCSELRRRNTLFNYYILEYNVNNYDWHAEQTSIKDNKENIIRLKTYLSKNKELVDLVQRQNEIEFDIDLNVRKLYFRLKYFFHRNADTEELRRNKAIMLETFSYEEFKNLIQYVGYGDFEKDTSYNYLGYFSKIYEFYFNQASTPEQLIFLYTNTPDFVFERIALDNEKVMQHLITLTEYDDTGFFSGWKDGSSALVNIFKTSSPGYIMNRFKKEPELCNRIYYNLDDISYVDGKPQSNRIIFAGIMRSFAQHHTIKEDAPIFKIKKGYRVNTKVNELSGTILGLFGQSDEKTFFLQQQQEQYIEKENYETDDLGVSTIAKSNTQETIYKDLDEGRQFLPLEMVYLEEEFDGVTTITKVPAIYVKALADAEKWAVINDRLRIAADIAAIILGVGTLATTGNPYLLLAAAADLSLALPDLTIQAFRAEIAKLPGGDEFLRQWDLIYNVLGSAVAAPQLVVGLAQLAAAFYRSCLSLLKTSVNVAENVKQGLRASAISVFLDLNSGVFQRKDLRMFTPTEWVIPSAGIISKTSECDALIQNGAFFMELDAAAIMESIGKKGGINPDTIGSISSNRRFALVYKGEIIAQGSRYDKAYQKVLHEIRKVSYSSEKVGEILESFVNRRRIVSVETGVNLGITPEKGIKMSFRLIDEFGNYAGELIRAQEKGDKLVYSLSVRGKPQKLNCFTRLLDEKSAQANRLPVYGNERMLMGDFNIPKAITDKYSGLGDLVLSDAMAFYQTNKKFGQLDGVIGWWKKATMYEDYGGQSINLTKFWEARLAGKSIEEASLSTFTGSRMKAKGFGKVRYNTLKNVIEENEVIINFIKK